MAHPLTATYRLQLHSGFTFEEAAGVADYVAALGISHVYASPCFAAAPGSLHGYDVVNPCRVNPEWGGEGGYERLRGALRQHGLGLILDIVPNHMSIAGRENAWWWHVLENGKGSCFARFFDIAWESGPAPQKIFLPVLGQPWEGAHHAGELRAVLEEGAFLLAYFDQRFPVALESSGRLLAEAAQRSRDLGLARCSEEADRLKRKPPCQADDFRQWRSDWERVQEDVRDRQQGVSEASAALHELLVETNGNWAKFRQLCDEQHYVLAYWREGQREINYRRFFDVNMLAAVRVEDPVVFQATHPLVIDWARGGKVEGLRVDHIDGLRDPEEYLARLRQHFPQGWIAVEKILHPEEEMVQSWPVQGTTGYEALNWINGLFVDPSGEEALTKFYRDFTGNTVGFEQTAWEKKHLAAEKIFRSGLDRLTAAFMGICRERWPERELKWRVARDVLAEVAACLPVYRTYARPDAGALSRSDQRWLREAAERARAHRPDLPPELIEGLLELHDLSDGSEVQVEFVLGFQQFTGPVAAKGVEDTAFYCDTRFVSLNEVGGDPGRFGMGRDEFHRACVGAQARWPQSLVATSTHDTKRSEDVRARLNVLSEMPDEWKRAVKRWARRNEGLRQHGLPDRNTEYLLYQTLVGAWPIEEDRLQAYMKKACREAKIHTSWLDPNPLFEEALDRFIKGVLAAEPLCRDMARFVRQMEEPARINALAQLLLKLSMPGVPDFYQGTELWDFSLVDPDNRRPVDYARRRQLLERAQAASVRDAWPEREEGLAKIWVVHRGLRIRREYAAAFGTEGAYESVATRGAHAEKVVAYVRGGVVAVVVPRFVHRAAGAWDDTVVELPEGSWREEFSGREWRSDIEVRELWKEFPIALLVRLQA